VSILGGVVSKESEQLDDFLREADELRSRRLVRAGALSDAVRLSSDGGGLSIALPTMDEEDLRSFLLGLRKFVSQSEPLHVNAIHNLLWKSIESESARDRLAEERRKWIQASRVGMIELVVDGQRIAPSDILDWWINGVYFHQDKRKKARLDSLGGLRDTIGRHQFNAQLVAVTNRVMFLAAFIRFARKEGVLHV
jgi:hypothetical protein